MPKFIEKVLNISRSFTDLDMSIVLSAGLQMLSTCKRDIRILMLATLKGSSIRFPVYIKIMKTDISVWKRYHDYFPVTVACNFSQ